MARPVGSTTRPQIRSYISKKEIEDITKMAVKKAQEGDTIMVKFMMEQIYGKAPQPQEHSGDVNLKVDYDKAFNSTSEAEGDSPE